MAADPSVPRLRGPFNFLATGLDEVGRYFPEIARSLPDPVPIFLGDGSSSPVWGYPVYQAPGLQLLDTALRDYLQAEERHQVARIDSDAVRDFTLKEQQQAWGRYRELILEISRNVMTSNFGRRFPELFWLHQSLSVARILKGSSGRIRKIDLEIGRARGDALRYVVLFEFLERVFALLFDLAGRLAAATSQVEDELFPDLLTRMRDNVLLFTEDHIGRDLKELGGYFRGYLKIDGRDLLYRLAVLRRWHRERIEEDPRLASASRGWTGPDRQVRDPDDLLYLPGYVEHLFALPGYDADEFLTAKEARLWSALVIRLKEFEFVHAARRLITPLEFRDGGYACDARSASRLGAGKDAKLIDSQTRPYDFTARWIVDPEVSRAGLIYDIRDFSSIVSILRLSERRRQTEAFQQFLIFQHRVESIIRALQLHSEKYLGDGAFFSGRNATRVLVAGIRIQRVYRESLERGLPFDKGMRVALNFASYHLLPLGSDAAAHQRYEVYGHGLVELSRLVSGKKGFDLAEVKNVLLARGYEDERVDDFFRPMVEADSSLKEQELPFRARLEADGTLLNEGIVATLPFLQKIERHHRGKLRVHEVDGSRFVCIEIVLEEQEPFVVGFRRLGLASFKGLDELPVFEVIDGSELDFDSGRIPSASGFLEAVEGSYTSGLTGSGLRR